MSTVLEHLGHTSFLVSGREWTVLIDPIVARQELDFRVPTCPEWFYGDLGQADAIFISHGHNDHLHPPSLLGFPPEVPVYFLDEDLTTCSCDDDPRRLLPSLGFRDIRPFRPGDGVRLEEMTVHVVPAQSSSEGEEQVCFLIETPDALILDAVDIKDSEITREALEPYRGRIDIAFLPTGAALQFEGFWNQMDTMEAIRFCRWLEPRRVATCGGSLSLAARPRLGSLERYPKDLADWLTIAARELGEEKLIHLRPPFRLEFDAGTLRRCRQIPRGQRYEDRNGSPPVRPLVTSYFTGYEPRRPTQRLTWVDSGLTHWLSSLQAVREIVQNARAELAYLVERCSPEMNLTPAGTLAPATLRHLKENGAIALASRLSALCPEPPEDPGDLEISFFAVAEALAESFPGLPEPLLRKLRACLWIDRRVYQLRNVHIRLRQFTDVSEERSRELVAQHLEGLRASAADRRPVLGVHHFRLDAEQAPLWTGEPLAEGEASVLGFPSPAGVHALRLSQIESFLLDCCDGRTFAEITADLSTHLEMRCEEVEHALFGLLGRLSRASVLLVDWSQ